MRPKCRELTLQMLIAQKKLKHVKNSKLPKKPCNVEIYLSSPGGGGVLESLRLFGLPIFSFFCTKIQSKMSPSISLKIKPCHRHQDPTYRSSTCLGQWLGRWRNGCVRFTGKYGKNRNSCGSENAFFPDQNKKACIWVD